MSAGDGGIVLLYSSGSPEASHDGQGYGRTQAVYPLRPLPPLAGHRPLVIEAAYALPTGASGLQLQYLVAQDVLPRRIYIAKRWRRESHT